MRSGQVGNLAGVGRSKVGLGEKGERAASKEVRDRKSVV